MDLSFFIDLLDANDDKLGSGPVSTATEFSCATRMDRAGEFSFSLPAADPNSDYIQNKIKVKAYVMESTGPVFVGGGCVDKIDTTLDDDGNVTLTVSGDDQMRELTYRSVLLLRLASGSSPITHAAALTAIAAFAPAGWTFIPDASPPNDSIYYEFAGESVLAALIQLAQHTDSHFYLSDDREITFQNTFDSSGIRAIEVPEVADVSQATVAYIENVETSNDTFDMVSRIYPYGDGAGTLALTLADSTRTAPTGYTLDTVNNYIKADATETTYGRIETVIQYGDIKPMGATPTDDINAANSLFDAALSDLKIRSVPGNFYNLSLSYCPVVLRPLQTIRSVIRRVVDDRVALSLNDVLNIIEVKSTVTAERGVRTTGLTVSSVERWPDADTDPIIELIKGSQLR